MKNPDGNKDSCLALVVKVTITLTPTKAHNKNNCGQRMTIMADLGSQ